MWLYFNENGQLVEALAHGPQPRAGSTDLKMFAYFEGKNISTDYTSARIKLIRPDMDGTSVEIESPYMTMKPSVKFEKGSDEKPIKFEDGKSYPVYLFDFCENMKDTDTGAVTEVLDIPGLWKAVIVLSNSSGRVSVQGTVTFSVG